MRPIRLRGVLAVSLAGQEGKQVAAMRVLAAGSAGLAAAGVGLAAGQALGAEHWGASFATAAAAEQAAAAAALAVTAAALGAMAVYAQGSAGFGGAGFGSAPAQQQQSLAAAIKAAARAAGVKTRAVKTASRGGSQRDLQEMRRRLSLVRDRQAACRAARQAAAAQPTTATLGEALSLEAFLTQTAPNAVRRTQAQIAAQLARRPRPAAAPALSEDEQRRIDPMFNALRGIGRFHREHRVRRNAG